VRWVGSVGGDGGPGDGGVLVGEEVFLSVGGANSIIVEIVGG